MWYLRENWLPPSNDLHQVDETELVTSECPHVHQEGPSNEVIKVFGCNKLDN